MTNLKEQKENLQKELKDLEDKIFKEQKEELELKYKGKYIKSIYTRDFYYIKDIHPTKYSDDNVAIVAYTMEYEKECHIIKDNALIEIFMPHYEEISKEHFYNRLKALTELILKEIA